MFNIFGRLFIGLTIVSLLYGCAGAAAPPIPASSVDLADLSRTQPDMAPFGKWVYLAQFYGEDLVVYRRQGVSLKYVRTLRDGVAGAQGTIATRNGWWYVANGGASNVLVYKSTSHGPGPDPVTTLNDPGQLPENVYVTPNRRLVAVSNATSNSSGAGSVSVYLDRQRDPARTLTYGSDPVEGTGVAIDHHGNCYWAFNDPNTKSGSIVEFSGCQGSGTLVESGLTKAEGIAFDQRDDLYYIDQPTGIYKCRKTADCKSFSNKFVLPVNMNFDHKSKLLWVADVSGYIYALDAKTGKIVYAKQGKGGHTDPPFGIAPAPGE